MNVVDDIQPLEDEPPSSYAERIGIRHTSQVSEMHKRKYGQFFTPLPIARYMASLVQTRRTKLRILDPGCGTAVLSCSLAEALVNSNSQIREIELEAYETDNTLIPLTQRSLNYLKKWLGLRGIAFTFLLHGSDFVLSNASTLENQNQSTAKYDLIISNPPYFKLSKSDDRARAVNDIVYGQPNIIRYFYM